ncbi:histidine phosphatase family protein [uncultured Tateyamaria sp.]|uniref:SixA phosphatase family protein n=1 Tax=Tateyamaria sp. 1078 TaxID=3417464 RepID=UPI0026302509|nr:histidine phosphatase family protein [uncultured Tateyamaria sp.]
MSRTLILMRHAKSSWDAPDLVDHDRPLNNRGRASARAMGDWMRAHTYRPDVAVSSTATRTGQTFVGLGLTCPVSYTRALYHAGPEAMASVLNAQTASAVLMLGHNPGIAEFAARLVKQAPRHARFADYPTGATTVIRWDVEDWKSVRWGAGVVMDFAIPREILGQT